jgi:hypothetical protein
MLGDYSEVLVKKKLQALMVCSDHEHPAPKIWAPMLHGLHESDQFTLVCGQFVVSRCHLPAEESHGPNALVEDGVEIVTRGVAFNDEHSVEVGQLEHRSHHECALESLEGRLGLGGPGEAVFLKQAHEWCCYVVVARDETPVVSGEVEEGTNRPDGPWHRPIDHGLDLLMIHGHTFCRDNVTQIDH